MDCASRDVSMVYELSQWSASNGWLRELGDNRGEMRNASWDDRNFCSSTLASGKCGKHGATGMNLNGNANPHYNHP